MRAPDPKRDDWAELIRFLAVTDLLIVALAIVIFVFGGHR